MDSSYGFIECGHTWPELEAIDWAQYTSSVDRSATNDRTHMDSCPYPLPDHLPDDAQRPVDPHRSFSLSDAPRDKSESGASIPSVGLFQAPLTSRNDPLASPGEPKCQRQQPRFEHDLYTAQWIRGQGTERAGWCGFCSSFHKMKDSAFWYHMHYSHGKSLLPGRTISQRVYIILHKWCAAVRLHPTNILR